MLLLLTLPWLWDGAVPPPSDPQVSARVVMRDFILLRWAPLPWGLCAAGTCPMQQRGGLVGCGATAGAVCRAQRRGEGFDHRDITGCGKPPALAACSGAFSALSPSPGAELLRVLLSFIAVLEEKCLSLALL